MSTARGNMMRAAAAYGISAGLSVAVAIIRLKLWQADLTIPFRYSGDALAQAGHIKAILEHGWFIENPCLGMPTGMMLYDYPVFNTLTFLFVKLLSLVLNNYSVILNLSYVLTFPLIACVSVFVFRRFGLSYLSSTVGGALYSLLPFHFLHGTSHLGLSSYYSVPLGMLLAYWMWDIGSRPQSVQKEPRRLGTGSTHAIATTLCIVLVALSHLYYVVFSLFGLLVAGLSSSVGSRKLRPAVIAFCFAAITAVITLSTSIPSLAYQQQHGPNPAPISRHPSQSLSHGLELAALLVPPAGYGVPAIDELRQKHVVAHREASRRAPPAYIGAVGVIGFLMLLFQLLKGGSSHRSDIRLGRFAVLNIAFLLLSTVGGFGYLFSLIVRPDIRVYNRVSIYIAFLSIAAVLVFVDRLSERLGRRRPGGILRGVLFGAIFMLGARDQTTQPWKPEYEKIARQYAIDQEFVSQLEQLLPSQAMVLQLPYVSFLTTELPHDIEQHDHLRPYLHSTSLRWSYGAIVGRSTDQWLRQTTALEAEEMLERVCLMGFEGVLLDRFGYANAGEEEIECLEYLIGKHGFNSPDGRYKFLELGDYCSTLRSRIDPRMWNQRREHEYLSLRQQSDVWNRRVHPMPPSRGE